MKIMESIQEVNESSDPVTPSDERMPTLPTSFRSLILCPIEIENENPQYLIELLGDLLGVTDYNTNMAAFWFLDFVALLLLRYKENLDLLDRGVLVSWLAGEILLIRENEFSHGDFLEVMARLFNEMMKRINRNESILYWDQINLDLLKDSEEQVTRISEAIVSDDESVENLKNENSIKSLDLLRIIIDATYDMYGTDFQFTLIYTGFVKPVKVHTYRLPYVIQKPRATRDGKFEENIATKVNKILSKDKSSKPVLKKTKTGSKNKVGERKKKNNIDETSVAPPPPPSPTEEEILIRNRQFILPLNEAIEAESIFKMYEETE
ncbi:uncharacterized protein LOC107263066 [Cephus cinctus]|uniref:Uncharacterized protein LOC107263066 n=1 Tax=Cephus cinctus TaxID=211228 RepID=A0AAJ7R8H2_CEPCN|nr:uncharacterized protein LOC107263066 [Cephus cinctus]